jgi:hypothetical protein
MLKKNKKILTINEDKIKKSMNIYRFRYFIYNIGL